ncbi:hypothetical protein DXG01_012053 [Tephrocybe rancida]|nr:hypothetical protein DXG01_012053 [Tephrocybe rancida]
MAPEVFNSLIECFRVRSVSVTEFLSYILSDSLLQSDPLVIDLRIHGSQLTSALTADQPYTITNFDLDWAHDVVKKKYKDEVCQLILDGEDWQFGAAKAAATKVENFKLEEMATLMESLSPALWELLDVLLSATKKPPGLTQPANPQAISNDEAEYWDQLDNANLEGLISAIMEKEPTRAGKLAARQKALITIVIGFSVFYTSSIRL